MFTMQKMDTNENNEILAEKADGAGTTYLTDREAGEYAGWKLYFRKQCEFTSWVVKTILTIVVLLAFKESHNIVRRIKAMEVHNGSFSSWYKTDFDECCMFPVDLRNLEEDKILLASWPELFDELVQMPTQTLSIIGLAMHNIVVNSSGTKGPEFYQHQKIYVMWVNYFKLCKTELE